MPNFRIVTTVTPTKCLLVEIVHKNGALIYRIVN